MASTSPFSRDDRLLARADLVVRPIPELRMCMVYRPRPARIITLNATGWTLFQLCRGSTVGEIEGAYGRAMAASGRTAGEDDVQQGLSALLDHRLVHVCDDTQSRLMEDHDGPVRN